MEVKADRDSDAQRSLAKIDALPSPLLLRRTTLGWKVFVTQHFLPAYLIKKSEGPFDDVEKILVAHEAAGIDTVRLGTRQLGRDPGTGANRDREVSVAAKKLELIGAEADPSIPAGQVEITTITVLKGRFLTLSDWVNRLPPKMISNAAAKLRDRRTDDGEIVERHLFIWVTGTSDTGIHWLLEHTDRTVELAKQSPPMLPAEISHLWIAGEVTSLGAVCWTPPLGWHAVRAIADLPDLRAEDPSIRG